MQKSPTRKMSKTSGFRSRMQTKAGRNVLSARRAKGRSQLTRTAAR